jgi:ribosome-binding protein aMBF1 (putative translation factor)
MDFLKFFNDQAMKAYPELNEAINNPNVELAYTITAERINQHISKQLLAEKLNCKVEEITRIEAGIFEQPVLVNEIVTFLNIEGDYFRQLNKNQISVG